jgi:hypothetical protein
MERFHVTEQKWFLVGAGMLISLTVIFLFLLTTPNRPQGTTMHERHHHHEAMMNEEPVSLAQQAKLLADKNESEFNHHLAGFFVLLGGTFILFQNTLIKRWPAVRYGWPACFLISGIFVLVWSDTELWPFGHRQWIEALQNNPEVLQHKIFALLLLGLGVVEWQRARGVLKASWSAWVYPAIAIVGSILVLFHHHDAGMHGPDHMVVMHRIQLQHLSYAMAGVSLGLMKGLAESKTDWRGRLQKAWPLLMMVLGVLLMFYRE